MNDKNGVYVSEKDCIQLVVLAIIGVWAIMYAVEKGVTKLIKFIKKSSKKNIQEEGVA